MSDAAEDTSPEDEAPWRYIGPPEPYEEFFWTSGADGRLRLQHCNECDRFHHPPQPLCPYCHTRELEPEAVAGTGTLVTYTVNHQAFMPGFDPPYVIGYVEIDEDRTIRLATNIVGCAPPEVTMDMRVEVTFEASGDFHVPLFRPIEA